MKLKLIFIVGTIVLSAFLAACGGGKKKQKSDAPKTTGEEQKKEYQRIMVNPNGQLISVPQNPKHPNDYDYIMVGPDKNIIAVPASEIEQNRQHQPGPYTDVLQPAYRY
ncbi:MAG: hypothetical protein H7A23_07330 [Leptospiraceae bacterium]|nr:hypothetical protein [Leptospiraceae bacterium]MCP5494352.1 hypothetical protein [Leptospiraceae bacterium]